MTELFVGLMSGTSLDGVDGVLVDFAAEDPSGRQAPSGLGTMKVLAHAHHPFPEALRDELLALNTPGGNDELHRAQLAGNALARLYSHVVAELCATGPWEPAQIIAIGAHGQTVRHQPRIDGQPGYSLQINSPALLAELTGIGVVADFRSRDVAAGGQGAPLVPAFHRALFGRPGEAGAVLNLGGISNLTVLAADGQTRGFDCGPANVLLDLWCQQNTGQPFDRHGDWAASGQVQTRLLDLLLDEPYFTLPPPKSTGRDLFNADWLAAKLRQLDGSLRADNVQATLCELTALTCANAVLTQAPTAKKLLVCGGGALNRHLMQRLAQHLPRVAVQPTDIRGLPAMQVEATAFAWLAWAHVHKLHGNLPAVTGAEGPRVLGAFYPG
jgi:anhydro-N-acetylmuramic acid kinase